MRSITKFMQASHKTTNLAKISIIILLVSWSLLCLCFFLEKTQTCGAWRFSNKIWYFLFYKSTNSKRWLRMLYASNPGNLVCHNAPVSYFAKQTQSAQHINPKPQQLQSRLIILKPKQSPKIQQWKLAFIVKKYIFLYSFVFIYLLCIKFFLFLPASATQSQIMLLL